MDSFPSSFYAELAKAGIEWGDNRSPILDGKIKRFKAKGDKEANSWYVLFDNSNGFIAGKFGCWKRGFTNQYTSLDRNGLSKEDSQKLNARWREAEAERKQDEKETADNARKRVKEVISEAFPALAHPYLEAKGFPSLPNGCSPVYISGDLMTEGWLALPLRDVEGVVHSAQYIAEDGAKRFQYGGRVKGCYFDLSNRDSGPVVICEGFATGLSLFAATGWSVKCAMNAGNLLEVSKAIAGLPELKAREIIIAADNDQFTENNPGVSKAREVVKALSNAVLTFPEFGDVALEDSPTDFNDLHRIEGLFSVRAQIEAAMPVIGIPIGSLQLDPENDPTEILRYRYLCQRGALLIQGPTGMGKSSFLVQMDACHANGLPFFGIVPVRPLKCLIIQAENDNGDMAQMRDGVCTGLGFNEEQRRMFFQNVIVYTVTNGLSGKKFCQEILARLLDLHCPVDFVDIDPALSFVGGNASAQEVVGDFLRNNINPILNMYETCCKMMHHTNKPMTGKEKGSWKNGDMAYLGSGSSEWANWARAILSLQSTGVPGYYTLHAAKRGAKLAWTDEKDELTYQKVIAWSRDKNTICWREPSAEEIATMLGNPDGKPNTAIDLNQIAEVLGPGLTNQEFQKVVMRDFEVSKRTYETYKSYLLNSGLIRKSNSRPPLYERVVQITPDNDLSRYPDP